MKRIFAAAILAVLLSGCAFNAKDFVAKQAVLDGPGITVGMTSQEVDAAGYVCATRVTSTAGTVDQCATRQARDEYAYDENGPDPTIGGHGITVGFDNDGKVVYVQ